MLGPFWTQAVAYMKWVCATQLYHRLLAVNATNISNAARRPLVQPTATFALEVGRVSKAHSTAGKCSKPAHT